MTDRPQKTIQDAQEVMFDLEMKLRRRLEEKGYGIFITSHEMLGVIDEEMLELKMAIIGNDPDPIKDELADIAVACIWGLVSMKK